MAKIKDLYAGKPDAKDEINYDGLEGFINTFVVPDGFNIDDLVAGNKFFITGYKGTGKTALLFFLDDYIKNIDDAACSSYIFFKEEFTDYRKNELEIMANRVMNSITIPDDTLLENTDFQYIWRWLLFKRIVADNEKYHYQLFEDNDDWLAFKNIIDKIKAPSDNRKVIIPPQVKVSIPFKNHADCTEISAEFEVDFTKAGVGTESGYLRFIELIDSAESLFANLSKTDIPYFIFIDELEAYYGDEKIFTRDLNLIRDLIFSVKRFNDIMMRFAHPAKIICSVRSEIIKAITRFVVPKEINKIIGGFEVPLTWNYNNTISYAHPIIQILIKRIRICEGNFDATDWEIFQKWFPEAIHDIPPASFILNSTWFKPRDIVRLLLAAQNSIEKERTCFDQAVFSACLNKYSSDSLMEIEEEMRALYNAEEIDLIITCFTGFRTTFSYSQLKKRVETLFPGTVLEAKFNEIITDLYRLGFLGNYLPSAKTYRWQHKGYDKVILSEEWRLIVHQALRGSLSLGARTDFGLSQNDAPQIGDVVEVSVKNIYKKFVFVSFSKGASQYDGVIHITEINGGKYINTPYEVVDIEDVFPAVIIGYSEQYKNWKLSKNKYTVS